MLTFQRLKDGTIKYIRQHWHDWLYVTISRGYEIPRFYLPVSVGRRSDATFCVNFLLAPIVFVWLAIYYSFLHIWHDSLELVEIIKRSVQRKRDRTIHPIGSIIELDPTKSYIALVDETVQDFENVANALTRDGSIISLKDPGCNIRFVENSDSIKETKIIKVEGK